MTNTTNNNNSLIARNAYGFLYAPDRWSEEEANRLGEIALWAGYDGDLETSDVAYAGLSPYATRREHHAALDLLYP